MFNIYNPYFVKSMAECSIVSYKIFDFPGNNNNLFGSFFRAIRLIQG